MSFYHIDSTKDENFPVRERKDMHHSPALLLHLLLEQKGSASDLNSAPTISCSVPHQCGEIYRGDQRTTIIRFRIDTRPELTVPLGA